MSHRRLTLAISEHNADGLIAWAGRLAQPEDVLHIVRAETPIPYAAMDWQLPLPPADSGPELSQTIQLAVSRLRQHRPDLPITEDFTTQFPATAMVSAAGRSDLLLVGPPHTGGGRATLSQSLARVSCPILIATGRVPDEPVVTALVRGRGTDEAVIETAFSIAERLHGEVLGVQPWNPPPDRTRLYLETEEEKQLDAAIEFAREQHPSVPAAATLVLSTTPTAVLSHLDGGGPVVLDLPAGWAPLDAALRELVWAGNRSVVVVPGPSEDRSLAGVGAASA